MILRKVPSYVLLAPLLAFATGAFLTSSSGADAPAPPPMVINEIMYHPDDDRDDLQFVELFNPGADALDVSGWSFTKGIEFVFPRPTVLPGGGFLVVCRDPAALRAHYRAQLTIAGTFTGKLSHKGERLELSDARGDRVDWVKYSDHLPWPGGADGEGASLERICPGAAGDDPDNWTCSKPKAGDPAGGTPGERNFSYSATPLPRVSDVRFDKAEPAKPVTVTAVVADPAGIDSVVLAWWAWSGEGEPSWTEVPMKRDSGDTRQGVYSGSIPAQPEGRLIRFTLQARNLSGVERFCPSKTESRPTFSCSTFVNTNNARIPFLKILSPSGVERASRPRNPRPGSSGGASKPLETRSPWNSAAIYSPPGAKEVSFFDHVHVRPRKGGLKVHFHKDQPLGEMTGINVIFEGSSRWVLSEPLSYELYRRAGVPAPISHHVRLWVAGRPLGYYLLVEQPNKAFLRHNGRAEDGNVYKALWYGQGLTGQHEKKTNPRAGHKDLVQVIDGLHRTSGAEQWAYIQQNFNVEEFANYYAVNMCIQNWDGFFNNYYAYHDLRSGGKWEMFPWDEDKTWGYYDGGPPNCDWYEMPLTIGMGSDSPAGGSWRGGGPYGGASWWRPPGHFSGPLLANREFRQRFLARVRELCETVFTPEKFGPVIQSLANRLEEEVRVRARLTDRDAEGAVRRFHENIESLRNQVVNRRKFLLESPEIAKLGRAAR